MAEKEDIEEKEDLKKILGEKKSKPKGRGIAIAAAGVVLATVVTIGGAIGITSRAEKNSERTSQNYTGVGVSDELSPPDLWEVEIRRQEGKPALMRAYRLVEDEGLPYGGKLVHLDLIQRNYYDDTPTSLERFLPFQRYLDLEKNRKKWELERRFEDEFNTGDDDDGLTPEILHQEELMNKMFERGLMEGMFGEEINEE